MACVRFVHSRRIPRMVGNTIPFSLGIENYPYWDSLETLQTKVKYLVSPGLERPVTPTVKQPIFRECRIDYYNFHVFHLGFAGEHLRQVL